MIRASKTFLANNNIKFNDQLFLTGYSEGGYATMAAIKEIEENFPDEFNVTGAAPIAGPYDVFSTAHEKLKNNTYSNPALFAFFIYSYNKIYNLGNLNEILQTEYADKLNSLFDGTHDIDYINNQLTTSINDLFQESFLNKFRGEDDMQIKELLKKNNIYDWKPKNHIRLYHSTADDLVPYQNSLTAYTYFINNGADKVELIPLDYGSHSEAFYPSHLKVKEWFDLLRIEN